jgi:hypothetical protein
VEWNANYKETTQRCISSTVNSSGIHDLSSTAPVHSKNMFKCQCSFGYDFRPTTSCTSSIVPKRADSIDLLPCSSQMILYILAFGKCADRCTPHLYSAHSRSHLQLSPSDADPPNNKANASKQHCRTGKHLRNQIASPIALD